jgi:hypothetical protein
LKFIWCYSLIVRTDGTLSRHTLYNSNAAWSTTQTNTI